MSAELLETSAVDLQGRLASGALRAVDFAAACLERIRRREPALKAWAWLDEDAVIRQAAACDDRLARGEAAGPLHGLPVGLKDIIDTAGMPTEFGTSLESGRVPEKDAAIVSRLKAAGAIIMGKTVTTELANRGPGQTTNPHNAAHTPGGSSSGSAAAVAAGMVPLAVGTQTAGSVIRPAAFCGVVGFKPSVGAISCEGVLQQSTTLDTVGVFARSVGDAALIADVLREDRNDDRGNRPGAPALAFVRQPGWPDADPAMCKAFDALAVALGTHCTTVDSSATTAELLKNHRTMHFAEMAYAYRDYHRRGRDVLCPDTVKAMDQGAQVPAHNYLAALEGRAIANAGLETIFRSFDAIITPAAKGPAPFGLQTTGDPVFNAIWAYCGTPAITLPLLQAPNGLPMGVQLVARVGDDDKLLQVAEWLAHFATGPALQQRLPSRA